METGQRLRPRPSSPSFTFMDQPLPQDRAKAAVSRPLVAAFGRTISYVRISVTDRCDFRCRYCMSEAMRFMPRSTVLRLEAIDRIAAAFLRRGVRRLRATGGAQPDRTRDV